MPLRRFGPTTVIDTDEIVSVDFRNGMWVFVLKTHTLQVNPSAAIDHWLAAQPYDYKVSRDIA
jgi:hypothetical protein